MLLDGIILTCSLQIQEERTPSAIYHLLHGKKSIQTVQDAHIYQLENFYGVFPTLSKKLFDQKINDLLSQGLLAISPYNNTVYQPTPAAKIWMKKNKRQQPFYGLKYYGSGPIFIQRLLLLIQTLSNIKMHHFSFIPVIDQSDVTEWVKKVYKQMNPLEDKGLSMLYDELSTLLNYFTEEEAAVFVDRITGFKDYGMSLEQLSMSYGMEKTDIQLLLTSLTHQMLDTIERDELHFPMMSFIVKDLPNNSFLTNSAQKTYQLIQNSYSVDEVARIRQLKENTICDHIVEIALYDRNFPIHNYVENKKYKEIMHAIKQTNSFKLKHIKEKVNHDISYFQIRLTLATAKNLLKRGGNSNAAATYIGKTFKKPL